MNKQDKNGTTKAPKRISINDLKKVIGGLRTAVPNIVEDNKGSKASPSFTDLPE